MKRFSKFIQESYELEEAVTVKKKDYSWGKMMTVHHGSSHSFPLHPEHQEKIRKLESGQKTTFKDETGANITAHRDGDTIHLKHPNVNKMTVVARKHFTESVDLDEDRKSSAYQFTHKPGDPESEKKLANLKASVKGTGKRVVLQGRLGKNNPNAHKYSKDAPRAKYVNGKRVNSDVSGKSGAHSHQRIQKADAAHHDVYVYDRNESVELDEAVEVSHDRYMRSHGKKASGVGGWFFTHKNGAVNNINDPKEVHFKQGKFSDAKKSAQQWAKMHGHSTVYVMEEVEQIDELKVPSKLQKAKFWLAYGKTPRQTASSEKSYAATKSSDSLERLKIGRTSDNVYRKGETPKNDKSIKFGSPAHMQIRAIDRELKKRNEEVELDENIAGRFKDASEWERSAKARGIFVKPATHPSGEMTKYQIAKDKQGNNRGHFDHGTKTGQLHEVSDKKLDAYRQKAFADQPAGDDGSDKYRKRKFGRDLAFAKQTGRAKVLATKEEVELDEASKEHLERLKSMLYKVKPGSADHSQIRHAISSMYGAKHIPEKHRNVKPDTYDY